MEREDSKTDIVIYRRENNPVVEVPQRLTVLESVLFKQTFDAVLKENGCQKIILNLSKTEFIDSSGVGALVHNLKATREENVTLILENVNAKVMMVLSITGLDQVLTITTEEEQKRPKKNCLTLPETHPSVRSRSKRLMDIVGSLVGLGITAMLFIPIVVAIKIDSPGPIFFSQTRCGWMGRKFRLWKFRSMCKNAEVLKAQVKNEASGAFFKNDNDPRITKVGRFLRRTSLDELPQFWNVLKGEMSLVGTRPPTPDEVETYETPAWQRLDVKPGMTGEWQVNGRSQVRNFEDVIKLDLRYQENWSLGYDLKLIMKTILIVFRKNSGAV